MTFQLSALDKDGGVGAGVTLMGFLRSTIKPSARCIKNRVNLWHRIRSISSACLILMLTRIEFTDGSMSTRSFSFRDIVRAFSNTSLEPLPWGSESEENGGEMYPLTPPRLLVCCDARRPEERMRSRLVGQRVRDIPEMGSSPVSTRRSRWT